VDIYPCALVGLPDDATRSWTFIQSDDIAFGEAGFDHWCARHGLPPEIDLLFIDTSHEYAHTKEELRVWMPKLASRGVVALHDTNLDHVIERLDGSLGTGWDNQRGVIRALEEFLGQSFDEKRPFVAVADNWLVHLVPYSSGLTMMRRIA
jgi:hypothetical protein